MSLELHPITPQDDPKMAEVIRTVMTEFGLTAKGFAIHDPEVAHLSRAYCASQKKYWVVKEGNDVVGGGGFAPLKYGPDFVCELQKMYFLPRARGTGIGERLLQLCLAEARKAGFSHCYLETAPQLNRAKALYEKNGFLPLEHSLGDTGHYGCTNWYLKELSAP